MATILDSVNVFEERCRIIGLSSESANALKASGIDTLNKIAFSSSFQVGAPDDGPLLAVLNDARLASAPPLAPASAGDKACFRRLHFEAQTMSLADLKVRVEATGETTPRRLPQAERSARQDSQISRLCGLSLTGDLEPSHGLIDLVFQQLEEGILRFVPLDQCTKRSQELTGIKKDSQVIKVSGTSLSVSNQEKPPVANLSTELRIKSAMMRRALAYDQAGLAKYASIMEWVDYLFEQLAREPVEGYSTVTMEQVLQADKCLWIKCAELTRKGLASSDPALPSPLEHAIQQARVDPQVFLLLMPLQRSAARSSASRPPMEGERAPKYPYGGKGSEPRGQSWSKGKGKGKNRSQIRLPKELAGLHHRTKDGANICFGYNLGHCSAVQPGQTCKRGKHVCMVPFCGEEHTHKQCPKKK